MRSMGRGTVRRTVEGRNPALGHDQSRYRIEVLQHIHGGNSQCPNSFACHPDIPLGIVLRLITPTMRLAIDFDSELGGRAVEIERVEAERMLMAKPQTEAKKAQMTPVGVLIGISIGL